MIHLFRAAGHVQGELERRKLRFCVIGGIALQHWGEPRVTRDVDVSVFAGFGGEAAVVDALLPAFVPRVGGAREFALRHRVLLLSTAEGVEVDIALAGLPFESEMIDRAVLVEYEPEVRLRICTAEDLFVLKAFADRVQDRADIIGIARRQGSRLHWDAILERLAPLAEAKEDATIIARACALRDEPTG